MYPINIICFNGITLENIKYLSDPDIIFDDLDNESIYIDEQIPGNDDHNYLSVTKLDSDIFAFYEEEQKLKILSHFNPPAFFLIQFTNFTLFKSFIARISSLNPLIDNDYGRILTAHEIYSINDYDEFINRVQ